MSVSHFAGLHNLCNSGTTIQGNHPISVDIVKNTTGNTYVWQAGRNLLSFTYSSSSAGVITVSWTGAMTDVNSYAFMAFPINSPNHGAALETYSASVRNIDTTSVEVSIHMWNTSTSAAPALTACSFVFVMFGSYSQPADTTWDWWHYLPDLVEGMSITTDYMQDLLNNCALIASVELMNHRSYDGTHTSFNVPSQAGVATYKTSIDQSDKRDWVIEPWGCGVQKHQFEKLEREADARLASFKLGSARSNQYQYAVCATPNPYATAGTRLRVGQPMQFRDAWMIAPRYYNHAGAVMSWADIDTTGLGAPDSFAFLEFENRSLYNSYGDAIVQLSSAMAANGYQSGIFLLTLIKENLDELKRIFENEHHATTGTHVRRPPGIIGSGRVVYSAGPTWTLQDWSTGIASVADIATVPDGCRMTFNSTFGSYRNWGMIVVAGKQGSTPGAAEYFAPQVVRNSATTADVFVFKDDGGGAPTSTRTDFNYILIGAQ